MLHRNVAHCGLIIASCALLSSHAIASTNALDALVTHCVGCHGANGAAPFRFDTLEGILRSRQLMHALIEDNTMPPWIADAPSRPLLHNRTLDAATKRQLLDALATPASAREAFARAKPSKPRESSDATLQFSPTTAWLMPASGGMRLRTYALEVGVAAPERVRGFRATDPREFGATPVRLAACAPDPTRALFKLQEPHEAGFEAMGNVGLTPSGALGAITRVAPSFELPAGFSFLLPRGGVAVETTAEPIGKFAPVRADFAWIAASATDTRVVRAIAIAPQHLRIPAGKTLEVPRTIEVPRDLDLVGIIVKGGAFLRSVNIDKRCVGAAAETLLAVSDYRLAFAEPWMFATPIPLQRDERVTVTFGYDNTMHNPQQPHAPAQEVIGGLPPDDEDSVVVLLVATRLVEPRLAPSR